MKLNLATKKFLVVDKVAVMRKAIRDMLGTLEAHYVVEADNGINALKELAREKFDVILCDYSLGDGKNGQQVLEEARLKKILPFQTVFIMTSSDQTISMVLGAMENKPDEYLAKPFNAQQLLVRLQRHFARKAYFFNIDREISRGNLSPAIQQCEQLLARNDNHMRLLTLKLRAELALKIGDYQTASDIYSELLQQRELPWARLGLGIVAFQQQDYERAAEILEQNTQSHPLFMESYDWLSKTYQHLDLPLQAQEILIQAVDLSPSSLLRQKKLALTADSNNNLDIAEQAYKSTLQLSKYSIHKSSKDFSNLAKLYQKNGNHNEALKTLDSMQLEYAGNPEAELRAATLETELYRNLGDKKLAESAFARSKALSDALGNKMPKDLQLDVVKACLLNNDQEKADKLLADLINNHIDDEIFLEEIRDMHRSIGQDTASESLIQKSKQALLKINNRGVGLFRKGHLQEAITLFEEAYTRMPNNKTIILNLARIALHELKSSGANEERLLRTKNYIKKAELIGIEEEKLNNIKHEFSRLIHSRANKNTDAA